MPSRPQISDVEASVIGVLIADDTPSYRRVLRILLEGDERFTVVGEAADGVEAIGQAAALRPDVVLLDVVMPRLHGLDALPRLRRAAPDTTVIVLSAADQADTADRAIALGAVGYIDKTLPPEELLDSLFAMAGTLAAVEEAVAEARSRLHPELRSAGSARRFVDSTLSSWSVGGPRDVVKLLVSELVTNAVVHARSEAEVVVQLTTTSIRVEVRDRSPELPVVRTPDPYDTSGRGMSLVDTFATAWGVRPLPTGKGIWFEVPRSD